jgi:hypothetical protein
MPDIHAALSAAQSTLSPHHPSPPHKEGGGSRGGMDSSPNPSNQHPKPDPKPLPPPRQPDSTSESLAGYDPEATARNRSHTRNRQRGQSKRRFLEALREYPLVMRAARLGGHHLSTFHRWADADPSFARAWEEALAVGVERLELRVHEDAIHGTDREATLQRMFALKRHKPEYREGFTVTHKSDRSGAQEAALLRRAVVEALADYPEARAALASVLARMTGTGSASGDELGAGATDPAARVGQHLERLQASTIAATDEDDVVEGEWSEGEESGP